MDDREEVEKSVKRGGPTGTRPKRYTFDDKLRAVKLHLKEGFIVEMACRESGANFSPIIATSRSASSPRASCNASPPPIPSSSCGHFSSWLRTRQTGG